MSNAVLDYLRGAYNPSKQAAMICLLSSAFVLLAFLTAPDFTDPYYVVGFAVTVFVIVVLIVILVSERSAAR